MYEHVQVIVCLYVGGRSGRVCVCCSRGSVVCVEYLCGQVLRFNLGCVLFMLCLVVYVEGITVV